MKETIYLVCDALGVQKMMKKPPRSKPGQAVVKVIVGIDDRAFRPPPMAEATLNVEIPALPMDRRTVAVTQEGMDA